MANFEIYYPELKKHEGGYNKIVGDKGGETYLGISRKNFPNWLGWKYIDTIKDKKNGQFFINLEPSVKEFYIANFWNKINANSIKSQTVANIYVDSAINHGIPRANKFVSDSLFKIGAKSINDSDSKKLAHQILDEREKFYRAIVAKNPNQSKFLTGWLNRIGKIKEKVPTDSIINFAMVGFFIGVLFFLLKK